MPLGVTGLLLVMFFWPGLLFVRKGWVRLSVCPAHRKECQARRLSRGFAWTGILLLVSSVILFVVLGDGNQTPDAPQFIVPPVCMMVGQIVILGTAVYTLFRHRLIHVKNISQRFIWLDRVPEEYLAQFPDLN
jgi:hypothetical protein